MFVGVLKKNYGWTSSGVLDHMVELALLEMGGFIC